jgi:hypothetical protein
LFLEQHADAAETKPMQKRLFRRIGILRYNLYCSRFEEQHAYAAET